MVFACLLAKGHKFVRMELPRAVFIELVIEGLGPHEPVLSLPRILHVFWRRRWRCRRSISDGGRRSRGQVLDALILHLGVKFTAILLREYAAVKKGAFS